MTTRVHSIMFSRKKYTADKARKWMKDNDMIRRKGKRVEKTENYLRYNITPKSDRYVYRTKRFGDDIVAVLEIHKRDFIPNRKKGGSKRLSRKPTKIQAVRFRKSAFTKKEASKWMKKHAYKVIRIDSGKNFWKARVLEPKKTKIYRTISFDKNVEAIVEISP